MIDFEKEYKDACQRNSDINEHLPRLSELAAECSVICELGVGWAQSTRAFLSNPNVELHSYEFRPFPEVVNFFNEAKQSGRNVTLHITDTRTVVIPECDMLFVDSLHTYEQVRKELELHSIQTKKYIGFHDTTTFEHNGEFGGEGIWRAIQEFLDTHPEWKMVERYTNNNGLTILKHE